MDARAMAELWRNYDRKEILLQLRWELCYTL